jgi:glycosyltransferase involved in cell wall biosynthesis
LLDDVIPNFTEAEKPRRALLLVSACRLTWEKGEERIYQLAEQFRNANIPFTWLVFSGQNLKRVIPSVVHCPTTLDVRSYFEKADYVVQLSDIESFCYTIAEALELGTPVLTTPIAVLPEIGFQEGVNGWIVPFNIKDADVTKYYEQIPESFKKPNRNDEIVKKWRKVLGKSKPTNSYRPDTEFIKVVVVEEYGDLELNKNMHVGEIVTMRKERALLLMARGYVEKAL